MNETIRIPDGLLHFQLGEQTLNIDPIEALRECNAIEERCKDKTNFEFLDEWAKWLNETCGVALKPSAAEAVWKQIHLERARSQRSFTDALQSLAGTESLPAD